MRYAVGFAHNSTTEDYCLVGGVGTFMGMATTAPRAEQTRQAGRWGRISDEDINVKQYGGTNLAIGFCVEPDRKGMVYFFTPDPKAGYSALNCNTADTLLQRAVHLLKTQYPFSDVTFGRNINDVFTHVHGTQPRRA